MMLTTNIASLMYNTQLNDSYNTLKLFKALSFL